MNVAIVGSRSINDYNLFQESLSEILGELMCDGTIIDCIVSGGASGVDTMAERYAKAHKIPTKICKPDWNTFGKRAGFLRNKQIVEYSDVVIVYWDGVSKGSKHDIDLAEKLKKRLIVKNLNDNETSQLAE
jgi:hypothetical protein